MGPAAPDLAALLRNLDPVLNDGVYVFSTAPPGMALGRLSPVATFRKAEGVTVIVAEAEADAAELPVLFRAAWIELRVQSDLASVGLTAAVARALAEAGISCNVVAAAHHDHRFVPADRADDALHQLRALQDRGSG